ncbi:DNA translocase FtsK [Pseudorhodobacter aquimaris]|uniref:DNA translocase FtsK n=1 Tax=Pseudorhodobacter aquimaris TaxID=687412 RepID=UPI00067DE0DD|nr:DNA translocase FtsK [Pseudorhodobacter aquimaris]
MASYQIRQRDPLVDQNTAAMLERRGRELLGIGLIVLALAFTALLGSYSATDPGWMVATDAPVNNWLGRLGASIASTLFIIGGLGSWGIPLILGAWGLRFVTHAGEDRAMGRVVFAVIAVALASVFAATHVPGPNWPHAAIGLGGLFGDTVLGAMLAILPIGSGFGLKLLSVAFGAGLLAIGLFVTGFDMRELTIIKRFVIFGTITAYAMAASVAGRSAAGAARAAQGYAEKKRTQREIAASHAQDDLIYSDRIQHAPLRAEPALGGFGRPKSLRPNMPQGYGAPSAPQPEAEPMVAQRHHDEVLERPTEKPGLLARMPQLIRRAAMPQAEHEPVAEPPLRSEDRIKARINDVIRSRVRQNPSPQAATVQSAVQAAIARREPPLTGQRGPAVQSTANHRPVVHAQALTHGPNMERLGAASRALPKAPEWLNSDSDTAEAPEVWDEEIATFDHNQEQDDSVLTEDDAPEVIRVSTPLPRAPVVEQRRIVQPAAAKPIAPSRQAKAEAQPGLKFEEKHSDYELPPLGLLTSADTVQRHTLSEEALEENARMLESVLDDYGVKGEIAAVRPGPVVTQYELEPAPGLKASRVIGLADDIARSMSALSARVSTVPGRSVIGIELPNSWREKVVLREILAARDFGDSAMSLPLALGKDIGGEPIVANLAKMPHLLIAGTTGSGKSVAINTMILSLLYKLTPEECRLIMIDPKMLELSVYDGIPHLLSPVVTDPKKAVVALKWVVGEMEERYRKMSKMGVRNIEGYNGRVREALAKGEMFKRTIQTGFDEDTGEPVFETEEDTPVSLPYIVVVVDEMADLMMVAGKEIEACIQRLAQMARASGIHLIMATQRPSVDVITGTIKANFPTRISFQVTSKIDSRTILGEMGAEQLLGMGDMLYMAGGAKITRIHGPFVSDEEVEEIVNHLKSYGPPSYMSGVVEGVDEDKESDIDLVLGLGSGDSSENELYDQAVAVVAKDRKCSTSYIQRKLGIGYNKAAKLVEQMEDNHVVTAANHVGKREILLPEH